jgi:hypothetical protein
MRSVVGRGRTTVVSVSWRHSWAASPQVIELTTRTQPQRDAGSTRRPGFIVYWLLSGDFPCARHTPASPSSYIMGKKPHPLAARIKRVMQADDEVGKIAQATPFLMGALPRQQWLARSGRLCACLSTARGALLNLRWYQNTSLCRTGARAVSSAPV